MAYILPEASNFVSVSPSAHIIPNAAFEIPVRYRNAFYLANSSVFDCVNWYIHKAYEVIFPTLRHRLKELKTDLTKEQYDEKIRNIIGMLEQCNSIIDVRFPIRRNSGSFEVIRGFRAQHGLSSGYQTTLGGFRVGNDITRDQMKGFSALQTYRNACMGIGMPGAHGGLKISPTEYTEDELQCIMKEYAVTLNNKGYCNGSDIMQPDMNSTSREMTWISGALSKFIDSSKVFASGKDLGAGGIDSYSDMAPHGASLALNMMLNNETLMKKCNLQPGLKNKTFIIQGIGKVGGPLAQLLVKQGAKCVGVKDHDAQVYCPQGIDVQKILECKQKYGTIDGHYPLAKADTSDAIYQEPTDILIFAAKHKSLLCYVAEHVKAKVILEAADCPITPSAHKTLIGKSRLVVPDIYACAGATIASYLEYISNLQQMDKLNDRILSQSSDVYGMTLKQSQQGIAAQSGSTSVSSVAEPYLSRSVVMDAIECILIDTGKEIFKYTDLLNLGMDFRTSAYIVAISKIFNNILQEKKLMV